MKFRPLFAGLCGLVIAVVLPAAGLGRGFGGGGLGGGLGGARMGGGGLAGGLGGEFGGERLGGGGFGGGMGDRGPGAAGLGGGFGGRAPDIGAGGASGFFDRGLSGGYFDRGLGGGGLNAGPGGAPRGGGLGAGAFGDGRIGGAGLGDFQGGGFGAAPSRGQLNSFLGLPSDEGLHNLSSGDFARASDNGAFNVQHGVVEGPRGGQAAGVAVQGPFGGEAARGVAVGPDGGVAAGRAAEGPRGAAAGQGIVAGPGGRVAGGSVARGPAGVAAARGFVAGPSGFAAGFARVTPSARYATATVCRGNFHDYGIYGARWNMAHPGAWFAAGWVAGRAWYPCTWSALATYFPYPIPAPVYYDYGNTVVYQNNDVYVNGQDAGTPAEYYDQAASLATAGTNANAPSDGDWLPLGVFLLTKSDTATSNMTFQIAVNRQGVIRGNYTDSADNDTQPIHGSVDMKTQRVAFTVGDKSTTVVETGLYNLTKDEAPALLHIGKDQTEQWLLVRLKNPDTPQTSPPAAQQ
jgi:hypothetical protein